jgi:menaquinone-9 beta-reductase
MIVGGPTATQASRSDRSLDDVDPVPPAELSCDVLVVGAGPAGTAAAIELVRGSRSVLVVDRAVFPRDKCCGDGLTTLALRELEHLGFDPGSVRDWFDVDSAWLRSPSGREVRVPLPNSGRFAAIAPRLQLDDSLVALARAAGADVRDGHGFAGFSGPLDAGHLDPGHLDAVVDGIGRVRCRYLVAADGMWSPVRKALGANEPGYLGEWHAFRQYARHVTGPAAERLYVWFEPDLLPGYAWSFPLPGGRANLGFGVLRDGTRRIQEMKALWADLLARPHIADALGPDAEMEGRHTAWPIPARVDQTALTSHRAFFVGDAAAATDVMTGEGIGQALLTGRLAAEAMLAAGATRPDEARRRYEQSVRHHLVADHRMSQLLGKALAHPLGARGAIRVVDSSGEWGRRNFARWMFEDEPRAVAATPSRWHRRLFGRDGAYAR